MREQGMPEWGDCVGDRASDRQADLLREHARRVERRHERGPITPLAVSALALLAERPMHPYEMYQTLVHRSEDRIVKVRPGSLYHTIERLEKHGFVRATGTEREGNRPERTTYAPTDAGLTALAERVGEMLATPVNEYPEFPVAIAEAHNLARQTVIELLTRRLSALRADQEFLEAGVATLEAKRLEPKYWLDVRYLLAMGRAEVDWLEALLHDIRSGAITW